jgi:hypothetical protein
MHLPTVDIDIVITIILVLSALYGAVGGASRLRNYILSTYAGIVLAQTFTAIAMTKVHGFAPDTISLGLLAAPIILFIVLHRGHGDKGSRLVNLVLGLVAGAFITAAGLHVIALSSAISATNGSFLAMTINSYELWIIGLMPLAAIVPQLLEKARKRDKRSRD